MEWRLAWSCAGFLIGVSLALFVQVSAIWGIFAGILGVLLFLYGRLYTTALLFPCIFIVGLGYGSAVFENERTAYAPLKGQIIELSGRVKEDPSSNASGYKSLQLNGVQIRGSPYGGSVFVRLKTKEEILRSDRVMVRGIAEDGFGSFSLNVKQPVLVGINRLDQGDVGRSIRDWFAGNVRQLIDEPQASLGVGYLTGQKSALPDDLSEALKIAGLTHIVVASGYNLTVLVRLARRLFLRISKFSAAMAAIGMVLVFMAVTGLSPSMTRAGIVSGLSILFWYYGRKVHPIILLLFVAAVTVAYQPSYVWGDLGWQLSFAAFFGVMVIGPLLHQYFYGAKKPGLVRQTLGETIAAHIATVPIIALQFGVVSNVAVVANLLVVPLVPLAMLLTFICGLWGIFSLGLAEYVAIPANLLLEYMVGVAMYVSEIKWAQSELAFPGFAWALYAAGVIGWCLWMWRATKYNLRTSDALDPTSRGSVTAAA